MSITYEHTLVYALNYAPLQAGALTWVLSLVTIELSMLHPVAAKVRHCLLPSHHATPPSFLIFVGFPLLTAPFSSLPLAIVHGRA
jgi:hypothetical protein